MVEKVKLRQMDGSVGVTLPRGMVDRLHVGPGDDVFVIETEDGILLTPFDPALLRAVDAYERTAARYRNALRDLAQ